MNSTEAYKQFQANNYLPVYLQNWYLDIACSDGKWKICYAEKEGCVQGISIYYIKKKLRLSYITMPTLVKYMGPFFDQSLAESDKQKVLDTMNLMLPSSSYFLQQWHPSTYAFVSESSMVIPFRERTTYLLNVEAEEDSLLQTMNDNYRRSIKKYKQEVYCDFRQKSTTFEVEAFIDLLESTMGSLADHKLSKEQVVQLVHTLEERGAGKLISVYYNNEHLGSSLISFDEHSAYYIFAANNRKFNKLYPGVQTAWRSILFLKENTEVKQIDFLGSSIESIAAVWKKLGATKNSYPLIESNPSPLFSLLSKGKNLWSNK